MEYTDIQIAYIKAITEVRKLTPICDECGYKTGNPRCPGDLGGYCTSYDQDNVIAFEEVISNLERFGNLPKDYYRNLPLSKIVELTDTDKAVIQDMISNGGKLVTNINGGHAEWHSLCDKKIAYKGYFNNKSYLQFTNAGEVMVKELFDGYQG